MLSWRNIAGRIIVWINHVWHNRVRQKQTNVSHNLLWFVWHPTVKTVLQKGVWQTNLFANFVRQEHVGQNCVRQNHVWQTIVWPNLAWRTRVWQSLVWRHRIQYVIFCWQHIVWRNLVTKYRLTPSHLDHIFFWTAGCLPAQCQEIRCLWTQKINDL